MAVPSIKSVPTQVSNLLKDLNFICRCYLRTALVRENVLGAVQYNYTRDFPHHGVLLGHIEIL